MSVMPQHMKGDDANEALIARIAQVTRLLRDSMYELGLDKTINEAALAIPDARDRLRYVANMSEQSATQVLTATEQAQPLQDELASQAKALLLLVQARQDVASDPILEQVLVYLKKVPVVTDQTNAQLMAIMMAQSFQDLTGQVIARMTTLIDVIERELIAVLLEGIGKERREEVRSLLNGPQINPNKPDVVDSQGQVDDLLESLGF